MIMDQFAPTAMTRQTTIAPPASLVHELVAYGVLSHAELISQLVEFEEVSVSHSAYRVSVGGKVRAFVKQSNPVRSQGRDLHFEAMLYRMAETEPALAGIVPGCQVISPDDTLIVLDPVLEAPSSSRWLLSGPVLDGPAGYSVLAAYGQAVARVHSVLPPPFGEAPWLLLAFELDWGDNLQMPSPVRRLFRDLSLQPTFRRGFRYASSMWQPRGLIHGDLRWTNVLLAKAETPQVWLIDWELSCLGDPAWDIGSVLADILSATSLALGQITTMQQFTNGAMPFLRAYHQTARPHPSTWDALLTRSILNAGVRLVQVVSEYGHISGSEMVTAKRLLIPWSVNLFRDAVHIAAELGRVVKQ